MMYRILTLAFALGLAVLGQPTLFQKPTVSKSQIVFVYAGDLWSVSREGGDAIRLTTGVGIETDPLFSPDGSMIAFTGEYDGSVDVFVVPASGGVPKRLTHHPALDTVVGWSPDGQSVLFRSNRNAYSRFSRLFTVPVTGGLPTEVQLPMAFHGAFSPDAKRLAYMPIQPSIATWKRYRGGQTSYLWIADLADAKTERIPRNNSNDINPMWVGDTVYFLSDRDGAYALYGFDTKSKKVANVLKNTGLDIKSASAGPGAIVYEQFGSIHLFDVKTAKSKKVDIRLRGDLPNVRPSLERVSGNINWLGLSPTGARAVFGARGEVFTVPAEKGDVRNLTNTPGAAERYPNWSPDGKKIAYFSDESGEYRLHVAPQNGVGPVEKYDIGPGFFYSPQWSPDSNKILFTDHRLKAWYFDLAAKKAVEVDTDTYDHPQRDLSPAWSPDSKWIAYAKLEKNHLRAVYVYSLETSKSTRITDGMSDARYVTWDKNGKHLYFAASNNAGLSTAWLDMSSLVPNPTRSLYVVVLTKADASPLAPESDEEKADEKKPDTPKPDPAKPEKKEVAVTIDFDGIGQRILALPVPPRAVFGTASPKTGQLFWWETASGGSGLMGPGAFTLQKFDFKTRKFDKVLDGVAAVDFSANGEKMLYRQGERYFIASTAAPPKPGEGALKTDQLEMRLDPVAEWKQIYKEIWRIQRDFFYDPNLHGVDWKEYSAKYAEYLPAVAHRQDLNYLAAEMLGELSVGHMNVGGGAVPNPKRVGVGLLGADYKLENGRYRFARVFTGENWNPQLRAPLTQPGVNVVAGEYLLAVNGRDLRDSDEVFAFFEGTAEKQVTLRVGPDPAGANSREVVVVPVGNEQGLRNLAWIEDNRRKVDQMTNGRVAYLWLPDTTFGGFTNFNRYYFAQTDKQAAVVDERFNSGGQVAEYIIDYLNRPLLSYWTTRWGNDFTTPQNSIYGPKVMIINEMAGSGGDALPWMFRQRKLGTLVGKRTWGGLVGIFGFPELIDGGRVTAPNLAFWNPNGTWDVENAGVPPDVEVEMDPAAWRAGRDTQLEKAVELVVAQLDKLPAPKHKKPAYPNYHPKPAAAIKSAPAGR
jgi:tricorn protease